ncbi:MAG: hypothetical protein RL223_3598 [Pseudomonadota bacterium]
MASITLRGLRKHYARHTTRHTVLHGIDLDIADGEFVVLVGPSGCGKSTLLRMIAGLEDISEGEIAIGGQRVNEREPKDRDIAMVFQNYALYPHMSVRQNLAYGLRLRGLPAAQIAQRVEAVARTLELDALLERRPKDLSGGQRQRVAMGRAIVREPAAFLFDEPLSNLDARLRVQMRLEIQRLHQRLGTTSVYVTHDQVEAMTLAQRMVVMRDGRIEQVGTPREVYQRPATAFVASFIGAPAMNLWRARVSADGAALQLDGGPWLPLPQRRADLAGRTVQAGVRPEQLQRQDAGGPPSRDAAGLPSGDRLSDGPVPSVHAALAVQFVESLGAEQLVHGLLGAQPAVVRLPDGRAPVPGDTLPLRWPAGAWHLFDADGGRRLD